MATLDEVRAQANSALAAGEHRKALSLALLMQRHFPRDFQTARLLGKIHLETHNLAEASKSFQTVLGVDPEDVVAWSALAIVAEEEGDLSRALECFGRAVGIDPANREVAAEVSRLQSRARQAGRQQPDSSMHSMARRFLAEGKFESAVPWLQEALRLSPDSIEVSMALARALWQSWRPREAREVALEVLAKRPNCLRALAINAAATYSVGGAESAHLLEETAALNPGNDVARSFFEAAGLAFPDDPGVADIPDSEVQDALSEASAESLPVSAALPEVAPESAVEEVETGALLQAETGTVVTPVEPGEPPETTNPLLRRLAALREASAAEDLEVREDKPAEPEVDPRIDAWLPASVEAGVVIAEEPSGLEEVPPGIATLPQEQATGETAQDHINAGAGFADQGLLDDAVAEYRAALKMDPSFAQDVSEALLALAETSPDNVKVRWLAGDALATDGKFRRAMEQYLQVLRAATSDSASSPGTVPG